MQAPLPPPARTLFDPLGHAFTKATALRFVRLLGAALRTVEQHTGAKLGRTLGPLVPADSSSYRRLFSQRRWPSGRLARLRAGWTLEHRLPPGPTFRAGDDTVDEHRGKNGSGTGRQRAPARSTHRYTAGRWGHSWGVVAGLVRFSFPRRRWALPVLVAR
jgi:hypothetical protein